MGVQHEILILGATGTVGRHLLSQALARGHEVTALVRHKAKLGTVHKRLRTIEGDALDPVAADEAVRGQEAVVFSLGRSQHWNPTTLFSDATRVLIAAMEKRGVHRIGVHHRHRRRGQQGPRGARSMT